MGVVYDIYVHVHRVAHCHIKGTGTVCHSESTIIHVLSQGVMLRERLLKVYFLQYVQYRAQDKKTLNQGDRANKRVSRPLSCNSDQIHVIIGGSLLRVYKCFLL